MKKESSHDEENKHTIPEDVAQRKQGRPRKQPKLGSNEEPLAPPPGFPPRRIQEEPIRPSLGFSSRTQPQPFSPPPGFSIRFQQQPDQPDQRDDDEVRVGQQFTGLIEETFEAGYLLSVKVPNSDIMLRGVVFKPGGCEPVSVDNDVAPDVPMIRRNTDVMHPHASAEGGSDVSSRALVPVPFKPALPTIPERMVVPVHVQPALPERMGVPVPFQPALPTIPEHMMAPVLVQHGPKETETGSQVTGASTGNPFELLTQPMKNGQAAESDEQAMSTEPLQATQPVHQVHVTRPVPSYGRGRMTRLLQENLSETHFSQGQ